MGIKLVSGQKEFINMTNKLDAKRYAIIKAQFWMNMLNDGMRPSRWLKPNAQGTKVNFDFIKENVQYESGLMDLEAYLHEVNYQYDLDLKLNRN